jgi:predicted DNA-binding protein
MIVGKKRGRPRSSSRLVPVMIMLPREIAENLTKISRRNGRSRSAHLGVILEGYCKEELHETQQTQS